MFNGGVFLFEICEAKTIMVSILVVIITKRFIASFEFKQSPVL